MNERGPTRVRIRKPIAVLLMAWAAAGAAAVHARAVPTGLTESIEKRLVQLDVAVEGDPAAIRAITANDLALYVGEHEVQGLIVDRLCVDERPPSAPARDEDVALSSAPVAARAVTRPRATYVLFFDQTHLTLEGRENAFVTARELIDRLVVEGSRASIVSSAKRLETFVAVTGDREKLFAGLEKLRKDPRHLESYAQTERSRKGTPSASCETMKVFAREEWMEAKRSTERMGITIGAIAELPTPKGLIYFGDNLRQKAGQHYLYACPKTRDSQFHMGGSSTGNRNFYFDEVTGGELIPSAADEFDAVVSEALARGVHFYTIQSEGITADYGTRVATPERYLNDLRRAHAQDALVLLAAQTGGEAFLAGASNSYIAGRIVKLNACRLLLSFPPGDLPRDQPLNVTLELHVPHAKIRAPGRIVVPSPASIKRAQLLAAFTDPASSDEGSLRALFIPRGGDGKTWRAGLQLRLRPPGVPDNSTELGASIVRRDKVTDHFASSIAAKSGARAIVLEKTMQLAPGEFYVAAVARDDRSGDIVSSRLDADWPNPAKCAAAITPIAVLQAGLAVISKDGALGSSGLLARDADEALDPSASVTLESVVCRGANIIEPVVVERWIEDGSLDEFAPMTIPESADPCIQIVDVLRSGRLQSGLIDYRVVARIGDEIVASERRTLRVGSNADGK